MGSQRQFKVVTLKGQWTVAADKISPSKEAGTIQLLDSDNRIVASVPVEQTLIVADIKSLDSID